MKATFILIFAMIGIVIAAGACVSVPQQASVEVSIDEFMKVKYISKQVEVPVGGVLTVTLGSNPTTGFKWSESANISDPTVVEQSEHKFVSPEAEGIAGAPGKEVWTFEALKKGTTEVSMDYSRPWEGGEKGEWTFKLTAVVK